MITQTIDQLRHGKLNRADSTLGIIAITFYIAQLINDYPQLWPLVGIGATVAITLILPLTIKQRKLAWIGLGILLVPCQGDLYTRTFPRNPAYPHTKLYGQPTFIGNEQHQSS
jgi:hypothetical protein